MVEINTETEFAGRAEVFSNFAHEIALQITSASPLYARDEDIPLHVLDEEMQAAAERARAAGKPEMIIQKIVTGVLGKDKNQRVLLRQTYIRDESITVAQLLNQVSAQTGENIVIRRLARWETCPEAENRDEGNRCGKKC